MPRSLWTGAISFGLVTIPVQLFSAIQEKDVHFHLLSEDGHCRLRRKLYCPDTGKEYDFDKTARGYEIAPSEYVIIEDKELEQIQPEAGRTINIVQFVDLSEIDPIYFNRPYFVGPGENGQKSYSLLSKALEESHRVAIAKFVMREHEYLSVLRPHEGAIILETLYYADEVKNIDEIRPEGKRHEVDAKELKLALQLLDTLTDAYDPTRFRDEYRENLLRLIEQKASGAKIVPSAEHAAPRPTKVVDLMEVLKASLKGQEKGEKPVTGTPKKRAGKRRSQPSKSRRHVA